MTGLGPVGATCESCAHLKPTATMERPTQRNHVPTITTFRCDKDAERRPWSVIHVACAEFKEP